MARDIKFLKQDLEKILTRVVDESLLLMVAERMRDIIYKRTKSGKGLSDNDDTPGATRLVDLKPLSNAYIRQRASKILGPFASASRSNLTNSGELLESLVVSKSRGSVSVEIENGQHSSGVNLKQLAGYVSEAGRPFFGLTDTEEKILQSFTDREIRNRIRKLNNR